MPHLVEIRPLGVTRLICIYIRFRDFLFFFLRRAHRSNCKPIFTLVKLFIKFSFGDLSIQKNAKVPFAPQIALIEKSRITFECQEIGEKCLYSR